MTKMVNIPHTILSTIFTFTNGSKVFNWNLFGGYEFDYPAWPVFISSVLLFSLLCKVNIKNRFFSQFLALCGKNTLGTYLISLLITDNWVCAPLQGIFTTAQDYMWVQLPAVLISFMLALVLSVLFNTVIQLFQKMVKGERKNGNPSIKTQVSH